MIDEYKTKYENKKQKGDQTHTKIGVRLVYSIVSPLICVTGDDEKKCDAHFHPFKGSARNYYRIL